MIHVGFTGTRHGMSPTQVKAVTMIVEHIKRAVELTVHHGDCVGADEDFHEIARSFGARVESHPGRNSLSRPVAKTGNDLRAFCEADVVHDVVGHFQRNRRIVDVSAAVIATPFEATHQDHGGTWYTVDYAVGLRKPLALVLPRSGAVVIEFSGGWDWPELPKEMTR